MTRENAEDRPTVIITATEVDPELIDALREGIPDIRWIFLPSTVESVTVVPPS